MTLITNTDPSHKKGATLNIHNRVVNKENVPDSLKVTIWRWTSVVISVYLLITAVKLVSSGFSMISGDYTTTLFSYVDNVFIALSIGILATVLTQSSSSTTAITVGLVASGMPLSVAIPVILGANVGTTVTSSLVALSSLPTEKDDREFFRRSFSAASVHDFSMC